MNKMDIIDQLRNIEDFAKLEGVHSTSDIAINSQSAQRVGGEVAVAQRTDGAASHLLLAVIEAAQTNTPTVPTFQLSGDLVTNINAKIAQIRKRIMHANAHVRKLLTYLAKNKKLVFVRANLREPQQHQDYCEIAQELVAQLQNLIEIIPLSTSAIHRICAPKLNSICIQHEKSQMLPPNASRLQIIVNNAIHTHQEEHKIAQLLDEFKKMDIILDVIETQCLSMRIDTH
jgi:hypothetical protein